MWPRKMEEEEEEEEGENKGERRCVNVVSTSRPSPVWQRTNTYIYIYINDVL